MLFFLFFTFVCVVTTSFDKFQLQCLLCLLLLPNCFFQSLLSHTLCSRFERFSTANNFSNLWCSKLQNVSTYAFWCWDDIFTQKGNCSSPSNLCKSPECLSPPSSNRSKAWNLYLSWSNFLVVPYVIELNVGHLSRHQNKLSDTDRLKRVFFHQMWLSDRCVYYEKNFWAEA